MNDLTLETTRRVVTLSAAYVHPKGGVAQVVQTYSKMYPMFNHIATKKGGSSIEKIWSLTRSLFQFCYICLSKEIRVVHVHGASNNSFRRKRIFIYIAKLSGKKVIYHVHGAEYKEFFRRSPRQIKAMFNLVDVTVALSESWKCFFENEVGHNRVKIIENVVPMPTLRSVTRDSYVHFLFLGELGPRKGIYDLLETVADNIGGLQGRAIFHVGGNGEVERVKSLITEWGLEEVVKFEGWVSGEKKIELLNLADVYILPSYNEGLPISVLEAMSYRLPIISTPVGGIPEVVSDRENGILVAPGDKNAIGDALMLLVQDEIFRKKAGAASYLKVHPYFPESVAGKLESVYQELLSES